MYDQPPPYAGIYEAPQPHKFDEKTRLSNVSSGFVDPANPNKVYVATAPPAVSFINYIIQIVNKYIKSFFINHFTH